MSKLHLADDDIQLSTVSVWVVVISPCFTPVVVIVIAKRWQKYLRARNSAGIERRPDYTTRIPLDQSMRFRCGRRGVRGESCQVSYTSGLYGAHGDWLTIATSVDSG